MRLISLFILTIITQFAFGQCDELDTSFNGDGTEAINVGNQSGTTDDVVASFITDTQIIVVGNCFFNGIKQGGVAYFDHDGNFIQKIKIGFSQISSHDYTVQAACLQHDGKLLVAGHLANFFQKGPAFIARVNTDGTMDDTFSGNGFQVNNFTDIDFNYMQYIYQHENGSIIVKGRGREHGEDLQAIQVNLNDAGDVTYSNVFSFSSFSTFELYEFVDGSVFHIQNTPKENIISHFSGEPFPMGTDDQIVINLLDINTKITGLNIMSNNRLAVYGYVIDEDEEFPIIFVYDELGNLDLNFNETGYKILDQPDFNTADIEVYNDVYYVTTVHSIYSGAAIHKLNLDGTAVHHSWSNPFQSLFPITRSASILLQDNALLIAGEISNDGQSDYGLIKYNACDYQETVFEDYPLTPIGELKEIDSEGIPVLEGNFSTIGVVSSINFSSGNQAFISIMDDENDGIFITGDITDFEYLPQLGDEILVSGILQSTFESTAELIWRYYRVESKNNTITTPIDVSELNTYSEGVYVRLQNVTLLNEQQWKGDGTTYTVSATDGTNVFDIKIFDTSYWSDKMAPQGEFTLSGFGGQDDPTIPYLSDFEIYPQIEMDIIENTGTAINESPIETFKIYPNPSTTNLIVDLKNYATSNFSVFDVTGKQYTPIWNGNTIDISMLANGAYNLILKDDNGAIIHTEEFIKYE